MLTGYLKWEDAVIGEIHDHTEVTFINPNYNSVVHTITRGASYWSPTEYSAFLLDRIISKDRRDIEELLYRLGIVSYDPILIAEATYAINPKDRLWVAPLLPVTFSEAMQHMFFPESATQSPNGQNIKCYARSNGFFGISKKRLYPLSSDAEAEVAVYKLASRLGVPACPAWMLDKDTVFSRFLYDYTGDSLVHARRFFAQGELTDNLYSDLINKFPSMVASIQQMCLLDFITRQDDRHLSNIAILFHGDEQCFYPLYDNGRSLFYEDAEELVSKAITDIPSYSTSFGPVGTYYDVLQYIPNPSELIDLSIRDSTVRAMLENSGLRGYRLDGASVWVCKCLSLLRNK